MNPPRDNGAAEELLDDIKRSTAPPHTGPASNPVESEWVERVHRERRRADFWKAAFWFLLFFFAACWFVTTCAPATE